MACSTIFIDGGAGTQLSIPPRYTSLDTPKAVYFGGVPDNFNGVDGSQIISLTYFEGCIRNMQVNPVLSLSYLNISTAIAANNVQTDGACNPGVSCASSPCANGGQCVQLFDSVSCKCTGVYTGQYCRTRELFTSNYP